MSPVGAKMTKIWGTEAQEIKKPSSHDRVSSATNTALLEQGGNLKGPKSMRAKVCRQEQWGTTYILDFWRDKKELVAQWKIPFQHTRKFSFNTYPKMLVGI